jgi:hypothetical protein
MKKLVLILLSAVSFMFAGSTSTSVPVTIDVTQTCSVNSFQASYDVGSVPTIIGTNGVMLDPLSFQINCSNGLGYQIKPDATSYEMGSDYSLDFWQEAGGHNSVSKYSPWNLTGTGSYETINLFARIRPSGSCVDAVDGKKLCSAGAISGSVTINIYW